MPQLKLSTLAIILGLLLGLPQIYGLLNPNAFRSAVRKFPRSMPWGFALMLTGTAWFLYNLSLESISDFASYKNILFAGFAGVGIGTCIFVQDFLAVRGLGWFCCCWQNSWSILAGLICNRPAGYCCFRPGLIV